MDHSISDFHADLVSRNAKSPALWSAGLLKEYESDD
jgi:hypothetical protein